MKIYNISGIRHTELKAYKISYLTILILQIGDDIVFEKPDMFCLDLGSRDADPCPEKIWIRIRRLL